MLDDHEGEAIEAVGAAEGAFEALKKDLLVASVATPPKYVC